MDPAITGLIHVTGEQDSGKTTFAITAGPEPSEIAFFDNDVKSKVLDQQLHFGVYYDLHRRFKESGQKSPLAYYEMVYGLIDELEEGKYKLLVFDNWTAMEEGLNMWADEHMLEISSLTQSQIQNMKMMAWPAKRRVYAAVLNLMLNKAPLVIVTTHLKDTYVGRNKTGQKEPRGQQPLAEKSSLRLWLRHRPEGPEPMGLVLKRISGAHYDKKSGKIEVVNILPRRLNPCTWDAIRGYLQDPVGNRALEPNEVPTVEELNILNGTLSEDQKTALRLALLATEEDNRSRIPTLNDVEAEAYESNEDAVKTMAGEGKKPAQIAMKLGMTVDEVKAVLDG